MPWLADNSQEELECEAGERDGQRYEGEFMTFSSSRKPANALADWKSSGPSPGAFDKFRGEERKLATFFEYASATRGQSRECVALHFLGRVEDEESRSAGFA
ncbi:uncharacterized protein LOC105701349 [Orussus abietinus]|uniref:uncharacterized protein LOC105701349 n=1 Tax=Orussus abietinus TaxID=222816 RepID=UPI000625D8BD|nr:uncharacterized protein LOC105701349 [Orussus abietinus]